MLPTQGAAGGTTPNTLAEGDIVIRTLDDNDQPLCMVVTCVEEDRVSCSYLSNDKIRTGVFAASELKLVTSEHRDQYAEFAKTHKGPVLTVVCPEDGIQILFDGMVRSFDRSGRLE
jgi:hypothetical protein